MMIWSLQSILVDTEMSCMSALCADFLTKEAAKVHAPNEDPLHMFSAKYRKVHRE